MHDLLLSGIPGSKPIGAMAAFGLLRIVATETPFGEARLSWRFASDWHPVLHASKPLRLESLIDFLIQRQPTRSEAKFLLWNDDIKCDPCKFRNEVIQASAGGVDDEICPYFTAFGSEAITAKSTPDVKPTAFHMTAGQQRFLKSCIELSRSLDPNKHSSRQTGEQRHAELGSIWNEALMGPWLYHAKVHSLGWDPTTEALYALSDRSPSKAKPRAVLGAVWLAFESLPLFPSVPGRRNLLTTAFDLRGSSFTWPIWESVISLESLKHWLAMPDIVEDTPSMRKLTRGGIAELFRARCIRDGNGRGTFRNAVQII